MKHTLFIFMLASGSAGLFAQNYVEPTLYSNRSSAIEIDVADDYLASGEFRIDLYLTIDLRKIEDSRRIDLIRFDNGTALTIYFPPPGADVPTVLPTMKYRLPVIEVWIQGQQWKQKDLQVTGPFETWSSCRHIGLGFSKTEAAFWLDGLVSSCRSTTLVDYLDGFTGGTLTLLDTNFIGSLHEVRMMDRPVQWCLERDPLIYSEVPNDHENLTGQWVFSSDNHTSLDEFVDLTPRANFARIVNPGGSDFVEHCNTSISNLDQSLEIDLNIFPNPSHDLIYFETPNHAPISRIELKNALGQTLLSESIPATSLSLVGLTRGNYWVVFQMASGKSVTRQVMKW